MAEHATKRIFQLGEYSYTITAYDEQVDPLKICFRVDKVRTQNPKDGPYFEIVREFADWPHGIQFVETDVLIPHWFNMIEQSIKHSGGQLPGE